MPRVITADEELKAAKAELKADPAGRRQAVTKIHMPVYIKVLEKCLTEKASISRTINNICYEYFEIKDSVGLHLDETAKTMLRALQEFFDCSPSEAINKLLTESAIPLMEVEAEKRQDKQAQVDRLLKK